MRYRIRVETTNRHVHVSRWIDADHPSDIENFEDNLTFGSALKRLDINTPDGARVHFNPAHVVAVTTEPEETP